MLKKFTLFCFLFSFCFNCLHAQAKLPEYGVYADKDLKLTSCPYDPNADAVILLDEGYNAYSEPNALVLYHRRRVKILTERGLRYANVEIPFYTGSDAEKVRNVRAMSYSPDGSTYVTTVLDSASVFTQKQDDYYSTLRFAIPIVKPGSIIEYSYDVIRPNYMPIPDWQFQTDIPVMKSALLFEYPILYPFKYFFKTDREHNVKVRRSPGQDPSVYFEVENVPALGEEPLMDAPVDNLMGVRFQLLGLQSLTGDQKDVLNNWKQLAVSLDDHPDMGLLFRKDISMDEPLNNELRTAQGDQEKTEVIFRYFKGHYAWDGYYSRFAPDGFKHVMQEHKGAAGELNLLLVKMLKQSGIEAYPLLAADRSHGMVDSIFPSLESFTKTVAIAYAGNRTYVLDATDENSSTDLIPARLLNTFVLQIDRKKPAFFRLKTSDPVYSRLIIVNASLSPDGILSGSLETSCGGYASLNDAKSYREDPALFGKTVAARSPAGLGVGKLNCEKDSASGAFYETAEFHFPVNADGGFVLLNYNFFRDLSANLFISPKRIAGIDFLYPLNINTECTIALPPGAVTEDLLQDQVIRTAEKDIMIARTIRRSGDELRINISFSQNVSFFPPYRYESVRNFYSGMQKMLDQPVVIQVKK